MLKQFDTYRFEILASTDKGVTAKVMCYNNTRFVGAMHFYTGEPLASSYLWHPNGTNDPDQIYIVLVMPVSFLSLVLDTLRAEKPLALEISHGAFDIGATTEGYYGMLREIDAEPTGEEEGL